MARKNQQLINYHTGSKTNMPATTDVQFGEIVVRHNHEEPQLMIKVSSGTSGTDSYGEWFVPFISSGKVSTEINSAVADAQGTIASDINNLEQKINAVSGTVKETYWTSATTKEYVDKAKNDAIETASGYTDTQIIALSGSVVEAIDGVTGGDLSDLKSRVQKLEVFSGKVETDYATKEFAQNEADDAELAAKIASSAYTDQEIAKLSGITSAYVASQLTGITGDISDLQSDVTKLKEFSGKVETDYATKEFVGAASGYAYTKAKEDLIGASTDAATADTIWGAKNYASSLTKTLSGDAVTAIEAEKTRATNAEQDITNKVNVVSGAVSAMSADIKTYIDNELSVVYKFKGTVQDVNELNAITGQENGDVYNVTSEIGTFGEEDYYPAGTNFAWDADANEGEGRWDALGGAFQTEDLATSAELDDLTDRVEALESDKQAIETNLAAVSGAVSALSASVVNNYSTTEQVDTKIGAASAAAVTSAYTSSTAYTVQQINALSAASSSYTDSKITEVNNEISNIKRDYAYSSYTHNEIENAKSAVVGTDDNTSADTNTLVGLKKYSDQKDAELSASVTTIVENLSGITSGQIATLSANVETAIGGLQSDVNDLKTSAATWNQKVGTAIQGAEFDEVESTDAHFDGGQTNDKKAVDTYSSGAKMMYTEGGNIKIDLSDLIIDCGDF